jgi:hypothetical protein
VEAAVLAADELTDEGWLVETLLLVAQLLVETVLLMLLSQPTGKLETFPEVVAFSFGLSQLAPVEKDIFCFRGGESQVE